MSLSAKIACLLLALSLCAWPQAKEHGGGGEGARKPDKDSSLAMEDFSKVMALQADDLQKDNIAAMAKCSTEAGKALQDAKPDHSKSVLDLSSCVHKNWDEFSRGLTKAQRNGLKPHLQAASKAEADLESAAKNPDAEKVRQSNKQFYAALQTLASQMGVEVKPQP